MTVQKLVTYNVLDTNGQVLNSDQNFELNIAEQSSNYLIHKDITRQQIAKKQGTVSTKVRSEVEHREKEENNNHQEVEPS